MLRDNASMTRPAWIEADVARIFVEGIDAYHDEIAPRGARITSRPTTKPWGLREMGVSTPDGHRLVFCEAVNR